MRPSTLYLLGALAMFVFGLITGLIAGNSALDIHLHDTYFVIAHFHIVLAVAVLFGVFAWVCFTFTWITRRRVNRTLTLIHFWVTFAGALCILWPMHYEGLAGMPRRYMQYNDWVSYRQFGGLNQFISLVAVAVFFAQLLLPINLIYSTGRRRRPEEATRRTRTI